MKKVAVAPKKKKKDDSSDDEDEDEDDEEEKVWERPGKTKNQKKKVEPPAEKLEVSAK